MASADAMSDIAPEVDISALLHPAPPNPYTFDLGHLLIHDANPLPTPAGAGSQLSESELRAVARNSAQALISQLLATCEVSNTGENGAPAFALPAGIMELPREKPAPDQNAKEPTKWEAFAARKGIAPKRKSERQNVEYDEDTGEWVKKWGYKGKNMREKQGAWLEELDENGEKIGKDAKDAKESTKGSSKGSGSSRAPKGKRK